MFGGRLPLLCGRHVAPVQLTWHSRCAAHSALAAEMLDVYLPLGACGRSSGVAKFWHSLQQQQLQQQQQQQQQQQRRVPPAKFKRGKDKRGRGGGGGGEEGVWRGAPCACCVLPMQRGARVRNLMPMACSAATPRVGTPSHTCSLQPALCSRGTSRSMPHAPWLRLVSSLAGTAASLAVFATGTNTLLCKCNCAGVVTRVVVLQVFERAGARRRATRLVLLQQEVTLTSA